MTPQTEIVILASIVAVACALPGSFLVLRKVSLMSDAISHAILLGLVVVFFIVHDLSSPFLILGAALTGILTVTLTELLIKTRKVKEDASIGLVFPVFFSLGVILISMFASDVHLDTDAVLLGEIAFAPFDRLTLFGINLPHALWVISGILLLNIVFISLFYKELKIATFDPSLAVTLGFSPGMIHYGLMALVSITTVGSFNAVGSILVVALMIAPPATAYLLTDHLVKMILGSALIGILSGIIGYLLARAFDASISGSMAMVTGLFFIAALLFSKKNGIVSQLINNRKKKVLFAAHTLLVHLLDHEGTKEEALENRVENAKKHMKWSPQLTGKVLGKALRESWITQKGNALFLTEKGRGIAKEVMRRT